ncbi:MAG TPA: sigma-70 family RNA polymerase sigma factor [Thermoanaerobaculia bacterium]|nr:sigma-70 family RNA polymerase sigma factor [Thermoanaerobaculia bacterium]
MWPRRSEASDSWGEDRALVRRMRAGDESAFEEFYDSYFQALYRFALARLGQDTELAKEMAQATVCKAIEKLGSYRGEAALFSWLCSICRFEISGHFKRAERSPPQVDLFLESGALRDALEALPALDDPENELLRREVAGLVHEAVDHLPPHYGQVLEWKYSDGLAVKEMAELLGMTPKAVESVLTRARLAFRDRFAILTRGR